MQTQTTFEPARVPGAQTASECIEADPQVQAALLRAQELLAIAQQTRDAAYARMAESPEDICEANSAVALAQQTVSELRAMCGERRSGQGTRNITQMISNLTSAVISAGDEVDTHEAECSSDSAKRTAHQAEANAKEDRKKRATSPPPAAPRKPRRNPLLDHHDEHHPPLLVPFWLMGNPFVLPDFHAPLAMRARDPRNHDSITSLREWNFSAVSLATATMTSPERRATAARITTNIVTAAGQGDRRGVLDGALSMGRGVARTTGSQDVGATVTNVVGATVTKSQTAAALVARGDVRELGRALWRNGEGVFGSVTSFLGVNGLENAIAPYMGTLMNDPCDFEHLVNPQRMRQFDANGNGLIEVGEILSVLRNNGKGFAELDADHSNSISYGELRSQLVGIAVRNRARRENA